MTRPNGFGPIDGKEKRRCLAEETGLLAFIDLADVFDAACGQQRRDPLSEIRLIGAINLGRDLEGHANSAGDLDGAINPFFRRDAANEGEITPTGP